MQFYETPTPNDEEKPSEPIPAETEAQVPKDRAAAKKAISGGFAYRVPNACMRAHFACGVFPARLSAELYGELRAKYDAELNRSVLIFGMTFRIHNTVLTLRFGFLRCWPCCSTLDGGVHVCPHFWRWRCMRQGTFWQQSCAACRSNRSRSAHSAFTWRGRRQASAIFVAPSCRLRGPFANLSFLLLFAAAAPILPCSSRCSRSTCCPPYRWTAAPRFYCCAAFSEKNGRAHSKPCRPSLRLPSARSGFRF